MTPPSPPVRISNQRNVLVNWMAFAFHAMVGFFLAPFIVRSLGDEAYGVWALLGSIVGYMGLLDLGVRSAVTRYTARFHARRQHADASGMAAAGLAAFAILGAVTIATAAVLAIFIDDFFRIPASLIPAARLVLIISGCNIGFALVNGVFGGVITALQRLDLIGGVEMAAEAFRAAAILLVLGNGGGLVGLALIHLGTTTIRVVAQWVVSRRLYPELRYRLRGWTRQQVRKMFSFSVYSTLIYISGTIIAQSDAIVIGAFLPVSMITMFAIGAALTVYARALNRPVVQTVPPRVSALDAQNATDRVAGITLSTARISSIVMMPLVATFMLRGETFIALWMGPEYGAPAGEVLFVLSIALAFSAGRTVFQGAFVGLNRHRRLVPWYLAEAVANVVLSVSLLRTMGITGVAWGTTFPSLFTSLIVVPLLARRALGTGVRRLYLEVWVRPAVAMVAFVAALFAMERWWPAEGLLMFFTQIALALPLAALGTWIVALDPDQRRNYVTAYLGRIRNRTGR